VVDFVPSNAQRQERGWSIFFWLIGPAAVGAAAGLRVRVDEKAVEERLKTEAAARTKAEASRKAVTPP
jgi:hypothetical protein